MNILTLDVETTISNNGHWADKTNKLVLVGHKWLNGETNLYKPSDTKQIQSDIDKADIIIGHHIKFDLHWYINININLTNKRVWCTQIAEFLLESQRNPYNSLNDACIKYGLETKLDIVKEEYWNKGIDTDQIPANILSEYLRKDLELTERVFLRQREEFQKKPPNLYRLFQLQCKDLLVLLDMEHNGIKFNTTEARKYAEELDTKMSELYRNILSIVGNGPLNINSNDHVSAILYGGIITETIKVPSGVYKTGQKAGQIKYKNEEKYYEFQRLVAPLERTETKKSIELQKKYHDDYSKFVNWIPESGDDVAPVLPIEPYKLYEVNTDVLRKLKAKGKAKELIDLLLEYSKLEKLKNTYMLGWSDLIDKMNWPKDMIHGNLNQCVASTGRLSSTKPNLQNADKLTKKFMESRYL